MRHLYKTALFISFTLFLTSCEKSVESHTSKQAQSSQDTYLIEQIDITQGQQDYIILLEWKNAQEKILSDATHTAINNLTHTQKTDPLWIQEMFNQVFLEKIESIKISADSLHIHTLEVKMLKDMLIEALTLSAEMIIQGEKIIKEPLNETYTAFVALQTKLNQITEDGQLLEKKLQEKYAIDYK